MESLSSTSPSFFSPSTYQAFSELEDLNNALNLLKRFQSRDGVPNPPSEILRKFTKRRRRKSKKSSIALSGVKDIPVLHELKEDSDENQCPICLDNVPPPTSAERCALPCGHTFHTECITLWMRTSHTCPNCRKIVDFQ